MNEAAAQSGSAPDLAALAGRIRTWGQELGFQQVGIADTALDVTEARLDEWLAEGRHGDMEWMARHGRKRTRPGELVPGTRRVISVRMDYHPAPDADDADDTLADPGRAFVSRYALGRDYHKLMRKRLQRLASRIRAETGSEGYRVFVDSAPVMEKPLAEKAGLGWIGKHTLLLNHRAGSWFFLGEIYTDLPLPVDTPGTDHCGSCRACIDVCPTGAITAPYQLDARLCVSYLTIEHQGSIPEHLRPLMGNRIFGCDDCQMVCPWNKFAQPTDEADFHPRHGLDTAALVSLFRWDEATFLARTEGSAIRRLGHQRWLRNIAVALGNAPTEPDVVAALQERADHPAELVREHVHWALARHGQSAQESHRE
ncbi:tRNA epoxyqueuosine(34) reductase QueG [Aquisalimonas lutea]|uniref:tRNA epoxyqueuosine(34) reductase QueG n=1 Tax=Aquisalimonas lutea TaxID=1327750 RepID=UPI0025B4E368|nr:tRNA epoxyqueuosine(34) reductase QueG [Aquisalimonas lutea]MDN3519292.1 tRNA epoxyqueuosine(34) reductase QueG [Aquisalimonas lutea]